MPLTTKENFISVREIISDKIILVKYVLHVVFIIISNLLDSFTHFKRGFLSVVTTLEHK